MGDRVLGTITLNSRLWPALVLLLGLLQVFFPYRGWTILFIGLGGAWLIGALWARSMAKHLSIKREMRFGWAQVGDMIEERFSLSNTSALPVIWVEIEDHSTIPGYQVSRATGVEGSGVNTWLTRQICSRRGLYRLGPTSFRTSDPFGLYTVRFENPASASLLVTPPVLPLPSIQVAAGGRAGEGRPSNKAIEETVVIDTVRAYAPGDSIRRIHWPTSARKNETFVKTFSNLPAGDWWIVLDLDASCQTGEGLASTEETAVILAASLADRGLRSGTPVGLITNSSEMAWIQPRLGEGQRLGILQALARVSPGPRSLNDFLVHVQPGLRTESSVIVITAAADGAWLKSLLAMVWRGAIPTVLVMDPKPYGGPGEVTGLAASLADLGITYYPITPDLINQPELYPQPQHRWEWRTLSTGRVIPLHQPGDVSWKALS